MVRFFPGAVGLLVAVVGWVVMILAATSTLVGLLFALCDMIYFGAK